MKQSEFRRWLAEQGVVFKEGSRHTKLYFNGKQSTLSRQPSSELAEGTRRGIIKQLGLKYPAP